jgi:hypothetical protein
MSDRQAFLLWAIATVVAAIVIVAIFGLVP